MFCQLFRILYPIALAVAIGTRYTIFSLGYLLFFLIYFAIYPIQRQFGLKPWFIKDKYFILSFIFAAISLLIQVIFQIFFAATNKDDGRWVVKLFGLQRYDNFLDGLQYLGPDLLMVLMNLLVVVLLNKKRRNETSRPATVMKPPSFRLLQWSTTVFLLFAAIAYPSFASLPYLLLFAAYFFTTFFRRYTESSDPTGASSHYWDLNLTTTAAETNNVLDVGNVPILDSTGRVVTPQPSGGEVNTNNFTADHSSVDFARSTSNMGNPHSSVQRGQKYLTLGKFMSASQQPQTIHDLANTTRQRTGSNLGFEPSQIHDVGGSANNSVCPSEEVLQVLTSQSYSPRIPLWILRILALYLSSHLIILYVISITKDWYTSIPKELGLISPFGWGDREWSLAFFIFLFHILSLIVLFILVMTTLGFQAQLKTVIELLAFGQHTFNLGLVNSRLDQVTKVPQLNLTRNQYDRVIGDCLHFSLYQASLYHPHLRDRRRMEARDGKFDPGAHAMMMNNPLQQQKTSLQRAPSQPPKTALHRAPSTAGSSTHTTNNNNTNHLNDSTHISSNEVMHSRFATHDIVSQSVNPRAQRNSSMSSTLFAAWDAVRVEFFVFTLYVARMACHIILLTSALFRPSIAGFVYIILFAVTCILSSQIFKKVTPIICIYSFLYTMALYITSIPGLVSPFRAAVPLGLDAPSAPFFVVLNAIAPALVCGAIFRWCSLTAVDIQALEFRENKKDQSFKTDQKIRVIYFIRALLMYLSDKFALLILFFTALYMVNVIHAIFLVTFIVFLSITTLARLLWPLLVYYSGIILLVLYSYGIIYPWANPGKTGSMIIGYQPQDIIKNNNHFETQSSISNHILRHRTLYSTLTNSSLASIEAIPFTSTPDEIIQDQFDYVYEPHVKRGIITTALSTVRSYLPSIPTPTLPSFLPDYNVNEALGAMFTSDYSIALETYELQIPRDDHERAKFQSQSALLRSFDDQFDQSIATAYQTVSKTSSRLLDQLINAVSNQFPAELRQKANKPLTGEQLYELGQFGVQQTTGTTASDIIGLFVPQDKLDWWKSLALYYCLFIVAAFQWNVYTSAVTQHVNSMFKYASPAWTTILNSVVLTVAYVGILFCSLPYRPSIIKFISAAFVIISFGLHTFMRRPQGVLKILWFIAVIYLAVVFVALYLFQFDKIQVWFTNLYPSTRFTVADLGFETAPKTRFGILRSMSGPVFAFILSVIYLRFLSAQVKREKNGEGGPTVEEYYEILSKRGALLDKEERHEREEQLWSEKNQRIQNMLSAVRDRQDVISQDVTRKRQESMAIWQEHQKYTNEAPQPDNALQINPLLLYNTTSMNSDNNYPPPPPTPQGRKRLGSMSAKNFETLTRNGLMLPNTLNTNNTDQYQPRVPLSPRTLETHIETADEQYSNNHGLQPYPPPHPPPQLNDNGDDDADADGNDGDEEQDDDGNNNDDEHARLNDELSRSSQSQAQRDDDETPSANLKKRLNSNLFKMAKQSANNSSNEHQQSMVQDNSSTQSSQQPLLPTHAEDDDYNDDEEEEAAPLPPPLQSQQNPQLSRTLSPSPQQQSSHFIPQKNSQALPSQQQPQHYSPPQQQQQFNNNSAPLYTIAQPQQQSVMMSGRDLERQGAVQMEQESNAIQQRSEELKQIFETQLPTQRTVAFWLLILFPKYIYDFSYSIATLSHKQMYKLVFIFAWLLITEIQSTNILNFGLLLIVIGFLFFNKGQHAWAPISIYSIILFTARYVFQIGQFNRNTYKDALAYIGFNYWGETIDGKLVLDQALIHTYGECILITLTCLQSIAYHHWRPKKVSPPEAQAKEYEKWLNKKEKKLRRTKMLERDIARKKLEYYQDQLAMETLMQQSSTDAQVSGQVEQLIQAKLNNALKNLQRANLNSAGSNSDVNPNAPAISIAGNDPSLDPSLFELDAMPTYQATFSPTIQHLGNTATRSPTIPPLSTVATAIPRPSSSSPVVAETDDDSDGEESTDYYGYTLGEEVDPVRADAARNLRRLPSAYAFAGTSSARMNQMRRSSVLQAAQQAVDQNRPLTAGAVVRPGSSEAKRASSTSQQDGIPGTNNPKQNFARLPWCRIFFKVFWDLLTRLVTFVFGSFPIIGMQLTFFLMLAAAIYRANVMSIVDVFGIVGAYVMLGRKRVAVGWSIIIAILSLRVLWQYWMTMGITNSSPWWSYPWHDMQRHYQRWLILGHFPISEVHFEYFAILMACFQRKYWNILIRLNKNPLLAISDIDHSKDPSEYTPEELEKRQKHYQAYLHQQRQLRKLNLISSEDADPNAALAYGTSGPMANENSNDGSFLLPQGGLQMTDLEKHHRYCRLSRLRNDEIHAQQLAYIRYQHVDLEQNIINPMIDNAMDPYSEVNVLRTGFNRDALLDGSQDEKIKLYCATGFIPPVNLDRKSASLPDQQRRQVEANMSMIAGYSMEDKMKELYNKMLNDEDYQLFLQQQRERDFYNYYDTCKPSPFMHISAGFDYICITQSPQDDSSLLTQWDTDSPQNSSPNSPSSSNENLFMTAPLLSPAQRIRSSNRFTFSSTSSDGLPGFNNNNNNNNTTNNNKIKSPHQQHSPPVSMMNTPGQQPTTNGTPIMTNVVTPDYIYASLNNEPSALTLGVQLDFVLAVADVSHLNQLNSSQYDVESVKPYDATMYTRENTDDLQNDGTAAQKKNNDFKKSTTFNPSAQIKEAAHTSNPLNSSSGSNGKLSKQQHTHQQPTQQRNLWDENQEVTAIVGSVWPYLRFILMLVSDKAIFVVLFALCIARANLVRVGYLILTLGLIIDKSLYIGEITQTRRFWTTLQRYNIFILSLITIYQCPFMPNFLSSNFIINGSNALTSESISWIQVIGIQRYRDKDLFENGFSGDAALHYILIFLFIEIQRCLFVSEPYLDVIHFWEKSRAQSELKGRVSAQARSDHRDLEIAMSKHTSLVLDEEFQGILNSVEQIEYAMSSKHNRITAAENPNAMYSGGLHTPTPQTTPLSTSSLNGLKLNHPNGGPLPPPSSTPSHYVSHDNTIMNSSSNNFISIRVQQSPLLQLGPTTSQSHEEVLRDIDSTFDQLNAKYNSLMSTPLPPPPSIPEYSTPFLDSNATNSTNSTTAIDDNIVSYNFFDDKLIWSDPTPANWSTAVEEEQLQKQHHLHIEESKLLQLRHELELFQLEMEVREQVLHDHNNNQQILQSKESLIQDSATQQKLVKRIEDRKKKVAARKRELKCKKFLLRNLHKFKLLLLRGIDPVLLQTYGEYYGNIVEMPSKSTPDQKPIFQLLYLLCCTHSQLLVIFIMLLNSWVNPSFLTLIALAAFLIVGILQAPRASSSFISFLFVYISVIAIAQFTFQMPIFCVESLSRNYSLQPNPQCFSSNGSQDGWKFDHLFGLYKAQDGTHLFLSWQLVVLMALAWHRTVLLGRGLWYKSEESLGDPALQRSIAFHEKKAELDKELSKRDRFIDHYKDNIRRGTDPTLITADMSDPTCSTYCWLKCMPQELKNTYFEIIPRSGRAIHSIKPGTDLYSIGFLIELIAAVWIVAAFTQMATTSISGVTAAISSNFIQGDMVICLCIQTILIVLDRIAYLKRSLLFKLVLHLAGIIYWGYSIFFQWPVGAMRGFSNNGYIQFFFFLKAIFYIISATQIQLGYPPQDSPVMQTLTKDVGLIRYLAFRIYRAVPFVYELRIILDWYCSKTSLDLWDTFKLDDIYCTLYIAQRLIWVRNKKSRGKSVDWVERFFTGIVLFCGLVIVLFIPLLLFSSANPGSSPNYVTSVELGVRIESPKGSYPISTISSLLRIEQAQTSIYNTMRQRSMVDRADKEAAVQILSLSTESDTAWDISTGSKDRLQADLAENYNAAAPATGLSEITLDIAFSFTRDNPPERPTLSIIQPVKINYGTLRQLLDILAGTATSVEVEEAVPKYFRLPATTNPQVLGDKSDLTGVRLSLVTPPGGQQSYWRVESTVTSIDAQALTVYTVSNPVWSAAFLAGLDYSIVAIYSIFVLAIGSFVRQVFAGNASRIIIEELPNVDRLLRFCQGIYIARAHGLLLQEEELFRKLVRIYRSPEKLVHLTARRPRKDGVESSVSKETNALPLAGSNHNILSASQASMKLNGSGGNNGSNNSFYNSSGDILPQSGEVTSVHRRKASVALKHEQDNLSHQLHQQVQALEYSRQQQSKRRH